MNQSEDFGKILKPWPNLVDHYILHVRLPWQLKHMKATDNLSGTPKHNH